MLVAGVLTGIMIVSILRNGEINWTVVGATFILSLYLFLSLLFIRRELKNK
ncbi:hypothetical protein GCM10007971_11760 [Oceanobacillus indicireducens]|uniref:Uncharacterized protein n=1 Tax=Oceanobacillus indicireducens TaxID=1004261 RepID=A0A917XW92_9BACI|nr:hypothetical protein GCM10007971_11760 [Oceanobacillus indicireducens]